MHARDGMSLRIGDSAHEHVRMRRGRYRAWAYVFAAAFVQWFAALLAIVFAAGRRLDALDAGPQLLVVFGLPTALVVATFWNRWRVVETFASRYTTGIANFSLMTATTMAWGYANVRFFLRLVGREARLAGR